MSKSSTFSSLISRDITGIPLEILKPTGMPYDEVADIPVTVRYEVDGDTIVVEERCTLEQDITEDNGEVIFSKGRAFFLTDDEQNAIAEEINSKLVGAMIDWAYERTIE